ncbi:MAG TPA: hypothetical protein PKM22_11670, partial [Candidatus Hydrogenedentes bacterium]|nr:hypothetical protein [Candidatus Hydrogenedentota bacterium]
MRRVAIVLLMALVLVAAGCRHLPARLAAGPLQPARLTCEYRQNPLGIDTAAPRLAWVNEAPNASARAKAQTAYRILAASSLEQI